MITVEKEHAITLTLAAFLAVTFLAAEAGGSSPSDTADPTMVLRQSFDMQIPVPPTPVTVAGTSRLVYELHLTNFSSVPLVLKQVEVLDAEDATVIAEVGDHALAQRLDRPHSSSADTGARTITPGMRGVVCFELTLDDDAPPRMLEHRILFHDAGEAAQRPDVVQGARVAIKTEPPVLLGPPLRGGPWAALYNPAWERGHRRVIYAFGGSARIPDRFAIDWVKLDSDGRRARGDDDVAANWYGYGADVLAVADALVVDTRDNIPESATLSGRLQYRFEDATGNYIVLDLGRDRYAFYKHLKPGSIRVAPGERVQRGQVIGTVGFSGQAGGPQLHFHVADTASPLGTGEGLPFAFESFNLLGIYDNFDALGNAAWIPLDKGAAATRRGELPAPGAVVDFGVID